MARTGLDEAILTVLVHGFYDKVRQDPVLGPVFEAKIDDWGLHLEKMVAFWSSVALMTGRYHGAPVPKHAGLPVTWAHFERWLHLFRETAREVCPPVGAEHVIERAQRIARSLHMAVRMPRGRAQDRPPPSPGSVQRRTWLHAGSDVTWPAPLSRCARGPGPPS